MIFSKKTEVLYKEMCGMVDFVCEKYIVISLTPKPNNNPAKLLVYRENFKEVQILKASTK